MRALMLAALIAFAFAAFEVADERGDKSHLRPDYRAPVANPPVEPDRPDLLEEPRIDR